MCDPFEDLPDIEIVGTLRGLYAFLKLQGRNTAQLNSKRRKAMQAYVYTYIAYTLIAFQFNSQSKSSVGQSASISHF